MTFADWPHTARIAAPRPPRLWPWLLLAILALLAILVTEARGATCPTWDDCWQAELRCEATARGPWPKCRRVVRRCFARWERCDA